MLSITSGLTHNVLKRRRFAPVVIEREGGEGGQRKVGGKLPAIDLDMAS